MKNGNIILDDGPHFSQNLTRSQFLESSVGRQSEIRVENEPYVSYYVRGRSFYGTPCIVSVFFHGQQLQEIGLYLEWSDIDQPNKWTVDTPIIEMRRHEHNVSFLKRILGEPPYEYNWGMIEAVYDQKSCSSLIIIRYYEDDSTTTPSD